MFEALRRWRNKGLKSEDSKPDVCVNISNGDRVFYSVRDLMRSMGFGNSNTINCNTVDGQTIAYATCSVLLTVITKKASAIKNARWWVVDSEDETRQIDGRKQEMDRWMHPNSFQSISEFTAMIEAFKDIYGKAYILRWEPVGMPDAYELYVIPNTLVQEVTTSGYVAFRPEPNVDHYLVTINGYQFYVPREEMYVVRDSTYNVNVFGGSQSRIVALGNAINTFVSSFEAQHELIINRGALGIISLGADDERTNILPENKEDRRLSQEALSRYGMMRGQYKYIVTGLKAAFVQISANMKDMDLTTVQKAAKKEIADAYQVPNVLIDTEGTTYANLADAEVKLYNDAIKPDAETMANVLNKAHGFDGFRIVPYFDYMSIFQESKRLYADSITAAVNATSSAIANGLMDVEQARNIIANIME